MFKKLFFVTIWLFVHNRAIAAAGGDAVPSFPNWYKNITVGMGLSEHWTPVVGSFLIVCGLLLIGLNYKKYVESMVNGDLVPTGRTSLASIVEIFSEFVFNLVNDLLGKHAKTHLGLLAGLFFFILISNLSGLFPFLPPSTADLSANLAMGLMVFIVYNFAGIREQGFGTYVKHFSGPKVKIPVLGLLLPMLIFLIEMISHGFRPVSLSLRLMGNIFGDHMLVAVFTGMVYVVVPSLLMFFGVLVSMVQSFVFTLLSAIYISMAVSHDH